MRGEHSRTSVPRLSVLYTNIRSLIKKRDDLCSVIDSCCADIVVLSETWLSAKIPNSELFSCHKHYTVYRADRPNRTGGGVLIALSNSLVASPVHINSSLELLWLTAECSYKQMILGVCYRPPSLGRTLVSDLHDSLDLIVTRYPKTPVFLLGDFNYPGILWSDTYPRLHAFSSDAATFLDLCKDFNLVQVVAAPTRVLGPSSSTLDLVLVSDPTIVSDIAYLPPLSDHVVMHFFINFPPNHRIKFTKTIRIFWKANFDAINNELNNFCSLFYNEFSDRSIQENWCHFRNMVDGLIKQFIPLVKFTTSPESPWFNWSIQRLRNRKLRLFHLARCSQTPQKWDSYQAAAAE